MIDRLRGRLAARLIADARQAWRYWSVQISALGMALSAAWVALPADTRAAIPGAQWIGLALFALIALSRIVQQGPRDA